MKFGYRLTLNEVWLPPNLILRFIHIIHKGFVVPFIEYGFCSFIHKTFKNSIVIEQKDYFPTFYNLQIEKRIVQ